MAIDTIQGGAFNDSGGNIIALGSITFLLSSPCRVTGTGQVVQNVVQSFPLDSSGNVAIGTPLWGNDQLTPSGTYYTINVYSSNGALVRGPESWQITGAPPIDLGSIVASTPAISYSNAVITTPSGDQTIQTNNLLPAVGNTTQSLGSVAAPWDGVFNAVAEMNKVQFVDGIINTTIQQAIAALNGANGIVDARGSGNLSIASSVTVGSNTQNVVLILGPYTYTGGSGANPVFLVHCRSKMVMDQGTVITTTSTTNNGVIVAGSASPNLGLAGGIYGSGLILGPNSSTGTGLILGGTSDVGNSPSNAANYVYVGQITVSGWGLGFSFGNTAYLTQFSHTEFYNNTNHGQFIGTNNVGENLHFGNCNFGGSTVNSAINVPAAAYELNFEGCSFDNCQINITASGPCIWHESQCHHEFPAGGTTNDYIVLSNANHLLELTNCFFYEGHSGAGRSEFILVNQGNVRVYGGLFQAFQSTGAVFTTFSGVTLEVHGLQTINFVNVWSGVISGFFVESTIYPGTGTPGLLYTNDQIWLYNKIGVYNSINTAGGGVPSIVAQNLSPNLQTNFNAGATKSLYQTVASGAYEFSGSLTVINSPTTGSVPNLNVIYTDIGGVIRTYQAWSSIASISSNSTNLYSSIPFYALANTNINVAVANYAPGAGGALAYSLALTVKAL